jgi:hypothetical protein
MLDSNYVHSDSEEEMLHENDDDILQPFQDFELHARILEKLLIVHKKWQTATPASIGSILETETAKKMNALSKKEVMVFVAETEKYQVKSELIIPKSWTKVKIANTLSQLLGDGSQVDKTKKQSATYAKSANTKPKKKTPIALTSLKTAAFAVLAKFPKDALNAIYAVYNFIKEEDAWEKKCPFGPLMAVQGVEEKRQWFSYPEKHGEMQRPVVKTLDGHHLLVNLRTKICKDGVNGIRKEAWHSVADHANECQQQQQQHSTAV